MASGEMCDVTTEELWDVWRLLPSKVRAGWQMCSFWLVSTLSWPWQAAHSTAYGNQAGQKWLLLSKHVDVCSCAFDHKSEVNHSTASYCHEAPSPNHHPTVTQGAWRAGAFSFFTSRVFPVWESNIAANTWKITKLLYFKEKLWPWKTMRIPSLYTSKLICDTERAHSNPNR